MFVLSPSFATKSLRGTYCTYVTKSLANLNTLLRVSCINICSTYYQTETLVLIPKTRYDYSVRPIEIIAPTTNKKRKKEHLFVFVCVRRRLEYKLKSFVSTINFVLIEFLSSYNKTINYYYC